MPPDRDRQALIAFLDWTAAKGIIPPATAGARKAVSSVVLGILNDDEATDVTTLNIDDVMRRFSNLNGKKYTPDSLKTYKSRLTKAVEDFTSYLENPMAFKPGSGTRTPRSTREKAPEQQARRNAEEHWRPAPTALPVATNIIPIPIRADLVIHIQGIPFDMTPSEAQRIANVVLALANSEKWNP